MRVGEVRSSLPAPTAGGAEAVAAAGPVSVLGDEQLRQPVRAYHANGRGCGAGHRQYWFRQGWRRVVLIVRGGDVAVINRRLRARAARPSPAPAGVRVGCFPDLYAALAGDPLDHVITL
jgi:hypothetical protein